MSAIIETHARGDFHVADDVKPVRAALRRASADGMASVFLTELERRPVTIRYSEVRRVRAPGEPSRLLRRVRGWGLMFVALVLTVLGTLGIGIGGSALVATMFGHADQIAVPWYAAVPGFAVFYAGGWVGHHACDLLAIE